MSRFVAAGLALLAWVDASPTVAQQRIFDPADPVAAFEAMAEYLARDGGRWIAENPNHDGSESSPSSFGLWFERDVNGHFLELQIVVHFSDRTIPSSRGHWAWHPTRRELTHVMIDRGGGLTEGVTTFPDGGTFVTLGTRFSTDGEAQHRDDNVIVDADVHRNETFNRVEGQWVSGGVYVWRRVRAG